MRTLKPAARGMAACLALSLLALLAACAASNADGPRGSAFRCNPRGDIEERLACDGR
jgi:hypothetical protein